MYSFIKSKLLILSIVPILFIILLSFMILSQILSDKKNLEQTKYHISKAIAISKVIYYMQKERGIISGILAKNTLDNDTSELDIISNQLDMAIDDAKSICIPSKNNNDFTLKIFDEIKINRKKYVNNLSSFDARSFYTKKISILLNQIKVIPSLMDDRENRNFIQAYVYLSSAKEALAQIRGTLNEVFTSAVFLDNVFYSTIGNLEVYNIATNSFKILATDCLLDTYKNNFKNAEIEETFKIINTTIKNKNSSNFSVNPHYWFIEATKTIDLLKQTEDELFKYVNVLIEKKLDFIFYKIVVIVSFLILTFIALAVSMFLLIKKILSSTDFLTGYENRYKLNSDIKELENLSIAVLNIDNFRQINDFYGHKFGDKIIISVANDIYNLVSNDNNLRFYRLQGDEFVILAPNENSRLFIQIVSIILNYIKTKDIKIDEETVSVTCSCGISFEEKKHLFSTADMALKMAKKGSNDYLIYDESISLNHEYENNIKCTRKLSNAIKEGNIITYYQPIVNNSNLAYEKYECLVRMIDDNKAIPPSLFLEIAKQTRQYFDITKTVITQSFETFKNKDVEFSINLSTIDILENQISEYILMMLQKYNIGSRVVFEIVESEYIENFEGVIDFINQVKKYNCKIAIDDFGTGYSNFEYLIKLQADYLKIDGSLIKNIDTDKNALLVVSTIVEFSKKLGMKVIAEYVENEEIFKIVKDLEIDYSQGYYFSAPKKEIYLKYNEYTRKI